MWDEVLSTTSTTEQLADGLAAQAKAHRAAAEIVDSAPEIETGESQEMAELTVRRNEEVATELSRLAWAIREADSTMTAGRLLSASRSEGSPLVEAVGRYRDLRLALTDEHLDPWGGTSYDFVVPLEDAPDCRRAWRAFEP